MAEEQDGARAWPRMASPFEKWQEAEGIPIYRGSYVEDMTWHPGYREAVDRP